ncbi:MAG TPA: VOC family protein [Aggregatilineales bacterium]|nr:VOC family protein [Aggregatilineales bacterium]
MDKRAIVHFEIPAINREAAGKFYHDAFGWNFTHVANYTTFETGNVGGGFPDVDGKTYKPDDVIIYIASDDIDADLKAIEKLGGKKLSDKMDVPGYGVFAFFADPTGNRMALFKGM